MCRRTCRTHRKYKTCTQYFLQKSHFKYLHVNGKILLIVSCVCDYTRVWIGNWIYWTLINRNTSSYNASVNLHTLQYPIACTTFSQLVFRSRCFVTALNHVDSSGSVFNGFCMCWLATISHLTHSSFCSVNWSVV